MLVAVGGSEVRNAEWAEIEVWSIPPADRTIPARCHSVGTSEGTTEVPFKKPLIYKRLEGVLAEGMGFEPTMRFVTA